MKKFLLITATIFCTYAIVYSQNTPSPTPTPPSPRPQQRPSAGFQLAEYGIDFQADPRLIVMMAALEAAGWNALPAGRTPSPFRAMVRKDLADLDPQVRERLRTFYERN